MHPKALLDTAAALVARVLAFDHPADATVARFFREHRALGPRERATLSETVYTLLRRLPRYRHLAESGSGPRERRLAALAFAAPREFLAAALREDEARWLASCDATDPQALPPALCHNLPDWACPASTPWSQWRLLCAMSVNAPASCCIWTPRSSGASCGPAIV